MTVEEFKRKWIYHYLWFQFLYLPVNLRKQKPKKLDGDLKIPIRIKPVTHIKDSVFNVTRNSEIQCQAFYPDQNSKEETGKIQKWNFEDQAYEPSEGCSYKIYKQDKENKYRPINSNGDFIEEREKCFKNRQSFRLTEGDYYYKEFIAAEGDILHFDCDKIEVTGMGVYVNDKKCPFELDDENHTVVEDMIANWTIFSPDLIGYNFNYHFADDTGKNGGSAYCTFENNILKMSRTKRGHIYCSLSFEGKEFTKIFIKGKVKGTNKNSYLKLYTGPQDKFNEIVNSDAGCNSLESVIKITSSEQEFSIEKQANITNETDVVILAISNDENNQSTLVNGESYVEIEKVILTYDKGGYLVEIDHEPKIIRTRIKYKLVEENNYTICQEAPPPGSENDWDSGYSDGWSEFKWAVKSKIVKNPYQKIILDIDDILYMGKSYKNNIYSKKVETNLIDVKNPKNIYWLNGSEIVHHGSWIAAGFGPFRGTVHNVYKIYPPVYYINPDLYYNRQNEDPILIYSGYNMAYTKADTGWPHKNGTTFGNLYNACNYNSTGHTWKNRFSGYEKWGGFYVLPQENKVWGTLQNSYQIVQIKKMELNFPNYDKQLYANDSIYQINCQSPLSIFTQENDLYKIINPDYPRPDYPEISITNYGPDTGASFAVAEDTDSISLWICKEISKTDPDGEFEPQAIWPNSIARYGVTIYEKGEIGDDDYIYDVKLSYYNNDDNHMIASIPPWRRKQYDAVNDDKLIYPNLEKYKEYTHGGNAAVVFTTQTREHHKSWFNKTDPF